MEKDSSNKMKTRLTRLKWMSALMAAGFLLATCYEWVLVDQPAEGSPNSTITVPIVLKPHPAGNFAYHARDYGCFGVLLPIGWTVEDSIPFSSKGETHAEPVEPYDDTGWIIYDEVYAQMYDDSAVIDYESRIVDNWNDKQFESVRNYSTPEGYYWWGGLTSDKVRVSWLDSIMLTVTIHTDDQTGDFQLQYAMGTLDYWPRTPVVEGGLSELMPITISDNTGVNEYLENQISVYPNPAENILTVDLGNVQSGDIQLIDLRGRIHIEQEINSGQHLIGVSELSAGTYLLRVSTMEGEYSKKVIVR